LGRRPGPWADGQGLGQTARALGRRPGPWADGQGLGKTGGETQRTSGNLWVTAWSGKRACGQVVSALCGGTGLRQKVDVTRQSFGRLVAIIDEPAADVKGFYKKIFRRGSGKSTGSCLSSQNVTGVEAKRGGKTSRQEEKEAGFLKIAGIQTPNC
jgi:hypothetical protein